jgi:hypothetical protein
MTTSEVLANAVSMAASEVLVCNFLKQYLKLAELAMVQIVGSVEDEKCFSMLAFLKSKLCSMFITHLPLVGFKVMC